MPSNEDVQQQMFATIQSWQQSGLTQKVYCEQHSIRYHIFHYWYKRFRASQSTPKEFGFIPLQTAPSPSLITAPAHTELLLPDGRRLVFHQPVSSDYLKQLIS
jgi:hypothetical protein